MENKDTVIVIGSGGRENAIVNALIKNHIKLNFNVVCFGPNVNPGISRYVNMVIVKLNKKDVIMDKIVEMRDSGKYNFLFAIIGPEQPIADGFTDSLEDLNIPCIAPTQKYAQIETNKLFCRNLLKSIENKRHTRISPDYTHATTINEVNDFSIKHSNNVVIKKTGLCGGKGVYVSDDHFSSNDEYQNICQHLLDNSVEFILEEKLIGNEFSLMTFCDGNGHYLHMPPIRDFKRAFNNDEGPNTGGMGCLIMENNTLPYLDDNDIQISCEINEYVAKELQESLGVNKNNIGYRGVLYGSFMKTIDGKIKVIEYNCRFGDPEVIIALHLLKNDFFDLCKDIVSGEMNYPINFLKDACVCKYLVPNGYPENPVKEFDIYISREINENNLYYASVSKENDHLFQLGSRAIAYVATGENTHNAALEVNRELKKIYGRLWFREDIGLQKLDGAYLESGVDIDKGNMIVQKIKPYLQSTNNSNVGGVYGDFNGLYTVPTIPGMSPMLVASTDGVGTKSIFIEKYLKEAGYYNLGQDLVNHCINDILVSGAYPLFFLDYFASSTIKTNEVVQFVKGISFACRKSGCVLLGGETAEMPDVYKDNRTDLVGTIVGQTSLPTQICGKQNICENDIVIGLPSTGLHTNGYSLIRKIKNENISAKHLKYLTQVHRSYLSEIQSLQHLGVKINGLCHITGGGLVDNPPRILPKHLRMKLLKQSWMNTDLTDFYDWIKTETGIKEEELYKVFNYGLGMLIIVNSNLYEIICRVLRKTSFYLVGKIEKRVSIELPQVVIQ